MRTSIIAACLIGAAAIAAPAAAQSGSPQVIRGALDASDPRDGRPYESNPVTLTAGKRYRIAVDSTAFDAVLQVYGPSGGDALAENDDGDGNNPRLEFTPATTGRYALRVLGFGNDAAGAYTISISELPPLAPPARPTPVGTDTITMRSYVGEIADGDQDKNGNKFDDYLFTFEAGKDVLIGVTADNAGFDTVVQVFTVNGRGGEPLASDDDGGGDLNSQLTFRPQTAGEYVVRVTTFQADGRGRYRLRVGQ